jgi:hypothetical protein
MTSQMSTHVVLAKYGRPHHEERHRQPDPDDRLECLARARAHASPSKISVWMGPPLGRAGSRNHSRPKTTS